MTGTWAVNRPYLASEMKDRMTKHKLSNRSAAKNIGVSFMTVNRAINQGPVDLNSLLKICDWLDTTPAFFLFKEVVPNV